MAHFYLPDGTPFYEVPNKARGGTRPAHLGDARMAGAYPSVTAIIDIPRKPALENWKVDQAIMAALTNPNIDHDADVKDICAFLKRDSMEQAKLAAEQGTAVHDAIEAHFLGKHIPPEHHATVNAVLALLEEKCGPQEWEAEKWFASPLGYGGKIDLISPEWVIDFKTKPGEASDHKMYDEQLMQLVAYDMGVPVRGGDEPHWTQGGNFPAPRRKANIIVSRDIPGSVSWWSWDGADEEKQWDLFRLLLQYWQTKNGYFPHMEVAA